MDKTKKISFTINPGIGDMLLCRNMFDSIKKNYDSITLSLNKNIVNMFREIGTDEYYNFSYNFMKFVFNESPYVIVENSGLPRFSPIENDYKGVQLTNEALYKFNDYSNFLCDNSQPIDEKYVNDTTKIRGTPHRLQYLEKYQSFLLDTILEVSKKYKIMLIGEKEPASSPENKTFLGGDLVYSQYNTLINYIPRNRIIDNTISNIQVAIPDINRIRKDCSLIKYANAVISLGVGGNMIMSAMTARQSINFLQNVNHVPYFAGVVNQQQRDGITITDNFEKFIKKCKEI